MSAKNKKLKIFDDCCGSHVSVDAERERGRAREKKGAAEKLVSEFLTLHDHLSRSYNIINSVYSDPTIDKMSRPLVSVFDVSSADKAVAQATLPAVMTAPIRGDVVQYVHTLMAKNKRQPYAVNKMSGMQVCYNCPL